MLEVKFDMEAVRDDTAEEVAEPLVDGVKPAVKLAAPDEEEDEERDDIIDDNLLFSSSSSHPYSLSNILTAFFSFIGFNMEDILFVITPSTHR